MRQPPRSVEPTTAFRRDIKRESKGVHRGQLEALLRPVLSALAADAPLPRSDFTQRDRGGGPDPAVERPPHGSKPSVASNWHNSGAKGPGQVNSLSLGKVPAPRRLRERCHPRCPTPSPPPA